MIFAFFVRNLLERPKEKLRRHTPGIAPEPTWSLVEPGRTKPEPSPERCWTWPGSAPRACPEPSPQPSPEPSPQPSPEPSPEPCWTWRDSAPTSPRPSPEPSPEPSPLRNLLSETLLNLTWLHQTLPDCWTWPGSAPKPPSPSPEPCWTWPGVCTKASGNLLRNPVDWPGACTSAHRSYSGLKTPLAYAIGEQTPKNKPTLVFFWGGDCSFGVVFFGGVVCFLFLFFFIILYNCFPFSSEWRSPTS